MLFQVNRQNVQAVSGLLYFLMHFLCLAFCLIYLMDLEHWHPFVQNFPESACLLQPGTGTSSKCSSENKPKKTQERHNLMGTLEVTGVSSCLVVRGLLMATWA